MKELDNLVYALSITTKSSLNDNLKLPLSFATSFFTSDAFTAKQKELEAKAKVQVAIVERGNEIIRALNMVAKVANR